MSETGDGPPIAIISKSNDVPDIGQNLIGKEQSNIINEIIENQEKQLTELDNLNNLNPTLPNQEGNADYSTEEEDNDNILVTLSEWNDISKEKSDQLPPTLATAQPSNIKSAPRPVITTNPNLINQNVSAPKPIVNEENGTINNLPIYEYDLDKGEKPWKKPGSDISDYFNYGFTEETWKCYCEKQRRLRADAANMRRNITEASLPIPPEKEQPKDTKPNMPDSLPSVLPTTPFPLPPNLLPGNLTFPPLPPGFQMPNFGGMPMNIPPELANSIAGLAASRVGFQPNMMPNLAGLSQFFPPGLNPQTFMSQFANLQPPKIFPNIDPQNNAQSYSNEPVVIEDNSYDNKDRNSDDAPQRDSADYKIGKSQKDRRSAERDRYRDARRYHNRRSRSRTRSRSRDREYRDRKKRDR